MSLRSAQVLVQTRNVISKSNSDFVRPCRMRRDVLSAQPADHKSHAQVARQVAVDFLMETAAIEKQLRE